MYPARVIVYQREHSVEAQRRIGSDRRGTQSVSRASVCGATKSYEWRRKKRHRDTLNKSEGNRLKLEGEQEKKGEQEETGGSSGRVWAREVGPCVQCQVARILARLPPVLCTSSASSSSHARAIQRSYTYNRWKKKKESKLCQCFLIIQTGSFFQLISVEIIFKIPW